jgi:enoyl-CoA hydratase/carnithine racemase
METKMTAEQVRLELKGKLAIVSLANPDGNRLNKAVLARLRAALDDIKQTDVRAVLVRGDGPIFSPGADIPELLTLPTESLLPIIQGYIDIIAEFEALPMATIAAVHGNCSSGGLEFALGFDHLWAAAGTQMGFLEPLLRLPPLAGGVQRIAARAGRARAFEITTAGRLFEAEELERWNIVNRVLPVDRLRDEAEAFAAKLASGPVSAFDAVKTLLRAWDRSGIAEADAITTQTVAKPLASQDSKATIEGYLARIAATQ